MKNRLSFFFIHNDMFNILVCSPIKNRLSFFFIHNDMFNILVYFFILKKFPLGRMWPLFCFLILLCLIYVTSHLANK